MLGDSGVSISGALYNSDLKWAAIRKAVETKLHIYLFISSVAAVPLPKRIIEERLLEAVRRVLKQHLGSKAMLKDN